MPGLPLRKLFLVVAVFLPLAAFAQPAADDVELADEEAPLDPVAEAAAEAAFFESLGFKAATADFPVGTNARVDVPPEFVATDGAGTKQFLEATQNLPNGRELATLLNKEEKYFIIFEFDPSGYVKDDDKDDLDADAMLQNMRDNQREANKRLKQMGAPELEVTGWHATPHYDEASHNLEWAPLLKDLSNQDVSVNYNVRILGRRGVMEAQLVASPEQMERALPKMREILKGFEFTQGEDYASFRAGDKVAEYGLAALVLGGAGAVAAKSGILGKLLKPLIAGVVILVGAVGSFFKKLFGGRGGDGA